MNVSRRNPLRVAAAALALTLAGCASSSGYHYSQLVGTRYFKTNIDTYPVLILEVDGRSYLGVPVLVDAGKRNGEFAPPTLTSVSPSVVGTAGGTLLTV